MSACKECGKNFEFDCTTGYARDLCSPYCDGLHTGKQSKKHIAPVLTPDKGGMNECLLDGEISKS